MSDTEQAAARALDQFRDDFAPWFLSLDATTRGYFDAIFQRNPQLVFESFTGQAPPDGTKLMGTLTEVLGEGAQDFYQTLPMPGATNVTVEPQGPDANTAFVIRWTDLNEGGKASRGHADQILVINMQTGDEVFTGPRVDVPALEPGAQTQVEQAVPGLPAGNYTVTISVNVDGAENPGDATASVGLKGFGSGVFGVGGSDPNRPATRGEANLNAVDEAGSYLGDAWQDTGLYPRQEAVALALQSYAGVLEAGLTAEDDLMPRLLAASQRARALEVGDPTAWRDAHLAELEAAMATLTQVRSLEISPAQGAEALIRFADGLA